MGASDDSWTTEAADIATEAAIVQHLLHLHPVQLTLSELIREIAGERPSFEERDAVERAVRDLVAAGILHRTESQLTPTRAALRLTQLLDR